MKSLFHNLALKICDFGADIYSNYLEEPIYGETASFPCLPPGRQRG